MADPADVASRRAALERFARFDVRAAPPAVVVSHVVLLLRTVVGDDPDGIGAWFMLPMADLAGHTPWQVIAAGEAETVATMLVRQLAGRYA